MPALTNIKVGSLRGTSGAEGTRVWPFFAKKSRKADRISLTPFIAYSTRGEKSRAERRTENALSFGKSTASGKNRKGPASRSRAFLAAGITPVEGERGRGPAT